MARNRTRLMLPFERPIAFYPALAHIAGGIREALFLQQLLYWSDKGGREDEFIYKTAEEIEEETTIPQRTQYDIRKKLERLGVLETKVIKAHGAPTVHYKVNIPMLQKLLNGSSRIRHIDVAETAKSLTKSTSETITRDSARAGGRPVFKKTRAVHQARDRKPTSLAPLGEILESWQPAELRKGERRGYVDSE